MSDPEKRSPAHGPGIVARLTVAFSVVLALAIAIHELAHVLATRYSATPSTVVFWAWLLLVFVVGVSAIYFASRSIALPVRAIEEVAARVADGDLDARAPVRGQGELAQLAANFNVMVDRLRATRESLERQVAERTTALEEANRELRDEIAQRRLGEERVALFTAAIDAAAEGIYLVGLDGKIIYVNKAVESISGIPPDEYVGKQIGSLSRDAAFPGNVIMPALLRHGVWFGEIQGTHRDGHATTLWLTASLVRDPAGGRPVAMIGITKDLTNQKRLEEEHIRNQKLESIGVLAGGLAHDFNNLLTIIIGNVDLARLFCEKSPEAVEALDHAAEAALRAGDLTRQLITFSKGGRPVKRVADLGRVLRDTATFASSGSNVACEFDIAPALPAVEFDEGQVRQVIHNLVQNAREAMPEGGTLRATAAAVDLAGGEIPGLPAGRYVRIAIADRGSGIAREHLNSIFDPYFSTKEMGTVKGRGLGLAVSHSIVRSHGGAIGVQSRLGAGTTVFLHLPASTAAPPPGEDDEEREGEAPGEAPASAAPRPEAATAPLRLPFRGRVLVLDDEPLVLDMAGAALRQLGYEPTLCRDGAEAVVRYQIGLDSGKPFRCAILDLTIPGGMGGPETLRRLQEIDPKVRAALSSGYTDDLAIREHLRAGFETFIAKPYSLKTLGELLAGIT